MYGRVNLRAVHKHCKTSSLPEPHHKPTAMPQVTWGGEITLRCCRHVPQPVCRMGVRGCLHEGGLSSHPHAVCVNLLLQTFSSLVHFHTHSWSCVVWLWLGHGDVASVLGMGTGMCHPQGPGMQTCMGTALLRWDTRASSDTQGDCDAASDPSARHLSIIALFPWENKGSLPHDSKIKNVMFCFFLFLSLSPLVLLGDYVEPAEKVFISVCKLNAPGVFLQLCPGLCWICWWSCSRVRHQRHIHAGNPAAKQSHFLSLHTSQKSHSVYWKSELIYSAKRVAELEALGCPKCSGITGDQPESTPEMHPFSFPSSFAQCWCLPKPSILNSSPAPISHPFWDGMAKAPLCHVTHGHFHSFNFTRLSCTYTNKFSHTILLNF